MEMGPEEGTDKVKVVVEKAPLQPKPSSTPIQQDAVVKKVTVKRTISEGSLDMVEKSIPEVVFPVEGVRYLYHISDIHIHLYKRHEEYQKVFDQLYTELRSRETGIIVVTGDILHNKDVISSEAEFYDDDELYDEDEFYDEDERNIYTHLQAKSDS